MGADPMKLSMHTHEKTKLYGNHSINAWLPSFAKS